MMRRLLVVAAGVLLCIGASALVWRLSGNALAVLAGAVILGLPLSWPLMALAVELYRSTRRAAYREVNGRHYSFRGTPVRVLTDEAEVRWVRLDDVRKVLGPGGSDAVLERLQGDTAKRFPDGGPLHLSADALVTHLQRDSRPIASKLRHWVQREIAGPARATRAREGLAIATDSEPPYVLKASPADE